MITTSLTYLEFYSGIGGWGYALEHACRSISVINAEQDNHNNNNNNLLLRPQLLAAYDHSDLCNSVFYHNHHTCITDNDHHSTTTIEPTLSSHSSSSYGKSKQKKKKRRTQKQNKDKQQQQQHYYKPRQTPIERLTTNDLQSHSANVWCMSPPCQPHTRQHTNQQNESNDVRSKSFKHLCHLLCNMDEETLPLLILLENVVGFEKSCVVVDSTTAIIGDNSNNNNINDNRNKKVDSSTKEMGIEQNSSNCDDEDKTYNGDGSGSGDGVGSFQTFRQALSKRNYNVAHLHLDPTHVGIPNNRPRHYTVAYRTRRCNEGDAEQRPQEKEQQLDDDDAPKKKEGGGTRYEHLFCKEMLNNVPIIHDESSLLIGEKKKGEGKREDSVVCSSVNSFLDANIPPHDKDGTSSSSEQQVMEKCESLKIPEKVRNSSSAWCFDIVTPDHKCTSCFTHSYGKFIRGTGSILYTGPLNMNSNNDDECRTNLKDGNVDTKGNDGGDISIPSIDRFQLLSPEKRTYDASWSKGIDWDRHMRYFSGTEVARLMGFPVDEQPAVASDDESYVASGGESYRKFTFLPHVTVKQQWKLLGNSLNVRLAAKVAEIGIQSVLKEIVEDDSSRILH